jgi:tight adherence protein B
MLIAIIAFLFILTLILGSYWALIVLPESRELAALRQRLKYEAPSKTATVRLLKTPDVLSSIGVLDVLLGRLGNVSGPLKEMLDQSGLPLTVGAFLLLTACSFFAAMVAVNFYFRLWWLALVVGAAAALVPNAVVRFARSRRIQQFEEQFPEAIELIARAMRAGHAFATGVKIAADELPEPAGSEFKLLYERQNYGAELPDALRTFAERIPSLDARFFVTAVLTQREAGGNLSEVLDRLAAVMRERFKIKREVRVRSAHGRITAYVLAGMPPSIAVLMLSSSPEQVKLLTSDPLGVKMIIGAVVLQVIGTLIVRKLVDIEY